MQRSWSYFCLAASSLLLAPAAPPSEGIVRPADPPSPAIRQQMIAWRDLYRQEMRPVRRQWAKVAAAVHDGRVTDLPLLCPDFRSRLQQLDRRRLLSVADPVVRTWLGRGLALLDDAAGQCQRHRFFALGFRLYKARHVLETVERRLDRY